MNLRFVGPHLRVGAVPLVCLGLIFQTVRLALDSTVLLETAATVVIVGLVIGTARFYVRIGLAAAIVNAALEAAVALTATGVALSVESRFDCGLGVRLFMYAAGLTVFVLVYSLGARMARRGLGEEEDIAARLGDLGLWPESGLTRTATVVWGCLSAYALTFFLMGATVGPTVVAETPAFTPAWRLLTAVSEQVGGVPPIGNDAADSLVRLVGTPASGPAFCEAR